MAIPMKVFHAPSGGEMLTANIVSSSARAVSSALTRTNVPTCSPLHLADPQRQLQRQQGGMRAPSSIVALSFAGIGQDRTNVEIWADSALNRNTHQIQVDADSARFSMFIENIPSQNPRTVESPRFRSSHTYVSLGRPGGSVLEEAPSWPESRRWPLERNSRRVGPQRW
jgi:hypothetical protein